MKAVKFLVKAVVAIVVLAVVALLALPLWFGPVAKTAANSVAPGILKTDFHLGHIALNPYSGRFELGDLQLSNPQGYSEKHAVTLGDIVFDCEPLSLATDVIHIEEIKVKDVFVSVVSKDGVGNFKQIQYNVAGGREKYEAAEAEKEAEAKKLELQGKLPAQDGAAKEQTATESEAAAKPEKKVIIDHLEISGIRMQLGILPVAIPITLSLNDIGRESGGATFQEAWGQIVAEVMKATGAVGDQLKSLGGSAGEAANKLVGGAAGAVGGAAGAVGDGAKKVGDGAKKALDSLKSLW